MTGSSPALFLASAAAVLARRNGHESVVVDYTITSPAGIRQGRARFSVGESDTFAVLVGRAEDEMASEEHPWVQPARPADACVVINTGPDGPPSIEVLEEGDRPARLEFSLQIAAALASGSSKPDTEIARLDLMPADENCAERARVTEFGTGPAGPAEPTPVHELFAARAQDTPGAVAIRSAKGSVTYAELAARAGTVSAHLAARGVGTNSIVGVLMKRSPELVAALLGVLGAGGAYLALDPADPPQRWAGLLEAAGARLLITDAEQAAFKVPGLGTLPFSELTAAPVRPSRAVAPVAVQPHHLAYVSYTSGSTGAPRGVAVPHQAVSRLVEHPAWLDIRSSDTFCQLSPVAFDASTLELWAPLANGATLVTAPPGPLDVGELAQFLVTEGVTVLWLTAGLFHAMATAHTDALANLRHLIAGGDVVAPAHVHRVLTAHPGLTFTNGYGPTENTTFTTCWTTTEAPSDTDRVPIGRPIDGTTVLLLDQALHPVPGGVRGEIYAAGMGLANGYLNDTRATAERFTECPDLPGERMYRTGDLGRWRDDGNLEFLGRIDDQVKIQGFRVEPGAVEARLATHPGVRHAVVVSQQDGSGGQRLLAYVTTDAANGDYEAFASKVRGWLASELPAYLVPWAVLVCDELPLNRNGKVDRSALPMHRRAPRNVWNDFVAPRSVQEAQLAALWGDMLGVEPVGVDDDFFDLGGHSILAAHLIERLQREYRVNLPARALYAQPTVAELARNIARLAPEGP